MTSGSSFTHILGNLFSAMRIQAWRHFAIIFTSLLFLLTGIIVKLKLGQPLDFSVWPYIEVALIMVLPILVIGSQLALLFYFIFILRPKNPLKAAKQFYSEILFDSRRYAKFIPVFFIMSLAFSAYTKCKELIGSLNPYKWDQTFMAWDRAIHFGRDPWTILHPIFGHPVTTLIINFAYNLWFVVTFTFWLGASWTKKDNGWERQFLLSFILCWFIGGFLMATYFSSMGPAFYDLIDSNNNPFEPQMDHLQSYREIFHIWALTAQDQLREAYLNPSATGIAGISAMPSLHNATTTLFVFAGFRIHKYLGIIMSFFLAFILIGSVHLAWHYAIDSYVGILIAILMWKISGIIINWQDKSVGHKY